MPSIAPQYLDAKFAALAHPLRRQIMERLSVEALTLKELSDPYDISVPAVAKHVKILESCGLIQRGPRSSTQPLSAVPSALDEVADWLLKNRLFWTTSFDRLDAMLRWGDA